MKQHTIMIVGHAKLPKDVASRSVYESMAFSLLIDRKYGVILRCEPTILIENGREYIRQLIIGLSMEDIDDIIAQIEDNYVGNALTAIISALKDAHRQYKHLKESNKI